MPVNKQREEDQMQQRKWILSGLCICTAVFAFLAGLITGKVVFTRQRATKRTTIDSIPDGANADTLDAIEEVSHDE